MFPSSSKVAPKKNQVPKTKSTVEEKTAKSQDRTTKSSAGEKLQETDNILRRNVFTESIVTHDKTYSDAVKTVLSDIPSSSMFDVNGDENKENVWVHVPLKAKKRPSQKTTPPINIQNKFSPLNSPKIKSAKLSTTGKAKKRQKDDA